MAWLLQSTQVDSSTGTPNMRNLQRNASIISIATFIAIDLDPTVLDLTLDCLLDNHIIGAQLQKRTMSVYNYCVTLQPAWSESTKHIVVTGCPLVSGMLLGIVSLASG